ncbi:hypothetical protein N9544_02875 [Flavobacteriales bacterium]|nr:hypothetical protein [Flavobacteriales bacterium]
MNIRLLFFLLLSINVSNIYAQEILAFDSLELAIQHKDSVTFLDLSGQGLKEFPKAIREFKNLQGIDLSNNEIKKIPKFIGELKKLDYINLEQN